MRSRYRILEPEAAHFVTGTVVEWLPVFTSDGCCEVLVQSLLHCRQHRALEIHAWVILDNHFHAILSGPALAETIHALKRHTAAALLKQIRSENRDWLLNQLAYYKAAHKTASRHQVWQEGVHPQAIAGDEMMLQSRAERDRLSEGQPARVPAEAGINMDYIHHNPVQRGWVVAPEHWRYSSAHEWLPGAQPSLKCDPWR